MNTKLDFIELNSIDISNMNPGQALILTAIESDYEFDDRFMFNLYNFYVKSDENLIEVIKSLFKKKYEFKYFDICQMTKNCYFNSMEYLTTRGYNLDIRNGRNENALFYVIKEDIAKYNIVDGEWVWWRTDDYMETIFEKCIKLGIDETVVSTQGKNLYHAYSTGVMNEKYLDTLMKYDININKIDKNGWTPLHHICANNSNDNAYKRFLKMGANKNILTTRSDIYIEDVLDFNPKSENCSAYDLRLAFLDAIGGEYGEETEHGDFLRNEIKFYLKPIL